MANINSSKKAAGVLPFFNNGTGFDVLLGKEYRERFNAYRWLEFGGKSDIKESGELETLAETAVREANEETAGFLGVTLEKVLTAESRGEFIDYYNEKTNIFYRMYCIKFENKIDLENIQKQVQRTTLENVEMVDWKYFNADNVIFSEDGTIFDDIESKRYIIYSTSLIRYKLLREQEFFRNSFY